MSSISTGTTTTTGYVVASDTTGALVLKTGASATTAVTIDTSQNATFAQTANLPNTFGFKNRIINGAMVIDQRNAGASVTPANAVYTLDRFISLQTTASKYSVQQNAGSVALPTGFANYLGCTSLSAYSVSAGDVFGVGQPIEGYNIADLGWGTASAATITLSFKVYSSLTGTFGGALQNSGSTRSYPFSYSVPVANTWTTISVTVAGDTAGTWLKTNGQGIVLVFGIGVGSTYSGTAGAWAGAAYYSATGATSVVGTNGATFYITGVQVEVGTVATSFDYRSIGTELALCQRYYEGTTALQYRAIASASYANSQNFSFLNEKRAAPTITIFGISATSGVYDRDGAGNTAVTATSYTYGFRLNLSAGQSGVFGMTASAEL